MWNEIEPAEEGVQEYVVEPDESVSDRVFTVVEPTISEPVTSAVLDVQTLSDDTVNVKVIVCPTSYVEYGTDAVALPSMYDPKLGPTLVLQECALSLSPEPVCATWIWGAELGGIIAAMPANALKIIIATNVYAMSFFLLIMNNHLNECPHHREVFC